MSRAEGNTLRPSSAAPGQTVFGNLPPDYPTEEWLAYYWSVNPRGELVSLKAPLRLPHGYSAACCEVEIGEEGCIDPLVKSCSRLGHVLLFSSPRRGIPGHTETRNSASLFCAFRVLPCIPRSRPQPICKGTLCTCASASNAVLQPVTGSARQISRRRRCAAQAHSAASGDGQLPTHSSTANPSSAFNAYHSP